MLPLSNAFPRTFSSKKPIRPVTSPIRKPFSRPFSMLLIFPMQRKRGRSICIRPNELWRSFSFKAIWRRFTTKTTSRPSIAKRPTSFNFKSVSSRISFVRRCVVSRRFATRSSDRSFFLSFFLLSLQFDVLSKIVQMDSLDHSAKAGGGGPTNANNKANFPWLFDLQLNLEIWKQIAKEADLQERSAQSETVEIQCRVFGAIRWKSQTSAETPFTTRTSASTASSFLIDGSPRKFLVRHCQCVFFCVFSIQRTNILFSFSLRSSFC